MMGTIAAAARALAEPIWQATLQATVLMIAVMIVSLACRRASPAFRCWLYCIVLLRLCIPVELILPFRVPAIPGAFAQFADSALPGKLPGESFGLSGLLSRTPAALRDTLAILWLTGALACGALIVWRAKRSADLTSRCRRIDRLDLTHAVAQLKLKYRIRRPVELFALNDESIQGPVTHGVLRPRILLPASMAESWEPSRLEPVILHELAHIRRFDIVINWIQVILQAIYFFHPLVWFVNRRIRELREEACDDEAARLVGRPEEYCRALLRVIETCQTSPARQYGVLALLDKPSFTRQRMIRLLAFDWARRPTGMSPMSTGLLLVLSCLCLAVASVSASTSPKAKACSPTACCTPCPKPACKPCPAPCCPPASQCVPGKANKTECCPPQCVPASGKKQC